MPGFRIWPSPAAVILRPSARRPSQVRPAPDRSPLVPLGPHRGPRGQQRRPKPSAPRAAVRTAASPERALRLRFVAQTPVRESACQDGVLANSSWAARSSAAAPSPKTSTEIDKTIATNKNRKPGSMERLIPPARGYLRRLSSVGERGDHRIGRVRDASDNASAQQIRLIQEYRNGFRALVKNCPNKWPVACGQTFLQPVRQDCNGAAGSQMPESGAN